MTTIMLCGTIACSQATFSSSSESDIWNIPFTWSLAVLRLLQGLTTFLTTYNLGSAFESVQWTLIEEVPYPLLSFLTMSGSTGIGGLLRLGLSKTSTLSQRCCSFLRWVKQSLKSIASRYWYYINRLLFLLLVSLASIALFGRMHYSVASFIQR